MATVETRAADGALTPDNTAFDINQPMVRNLAKNISVWWIYLCFHNAKISQQLVKTRPSANMTLEQLERMSAEQKAKTVLVVQDRLPATTTPGSWRTFIRGGKAGQRPVLLPFSPNGKARHIKVFLIALRKRRKKPLSSLIGSPRWGYRWWCRSGTGSVLSRRIQTGAGRTARRFSCVAGE